MISKSVEETAKIAQSVAEKLKAGKAATVLALHGDLGSGKTTFTKAFAAALGVNSDEVTSPTFVIMKSYEVADPRMLMLGWRNLVHIDAYRLEMPAQASQIGWDKIAADPSNIVLIEWPEKMGEKIPHGARKLDFKFIDDSSREIVVD
ncbi:MAG TPA: tRNA (adenosine(37)-N6)-threonylcarbamoyltransferase complex ATPase subunit type 1 TsaE [Candidatus Paceibacterota bacterium]